MHLIIDADTLVLRSALTVQKSFVKVKNKKSGVTKTFDSVTSFWGGWRTKQGGWLKELEDFLGVDVDRGCFEIEQCSELISNSPIEDAYTNFCFQLGDVVEKTNPSYYTICLGGGSNFRYDVAKILPYKGQRSEKPIIYEELRKYVAEEFSSKVVVAEYCEADDVCSILAAKAKASKEPHCIAYIDKDLDQIPGHYFYYHTKESGIRTQEEAIRCFCTQLLTGDKATDNIQGLPGLTEDFRRKYGLRNQKGLGKTTASKLLDSKGIKEMFSIVVEAYRDYYEEPVTFKSHDGKTYTYSWLDFLKENATLLKLQTKQGERYDICNTLAYLQINY